MAMESLTKTLTNAFVLAALLTDYLVLFDFWIITPPTSSSGPPTPQRKRWLAGLRTTVCYAITQPLWAWAVAKSSADGVFWILMASYISILSGLGALSIFDAHLQTVVKEHNEQCLDIETYSNEPDAKSNELVNLDKARIVVVNGGNDGSQAEKAALPSGPNQQQRPCTRHSFPSSYYLAILLPTITAAAADSGLLFFARFLASKDSMDWIQGSAVGWSILTSVAAFSYAASKVMNWMPASFVNRGLPPAKTRSWKAWTIFVAEKAVLLLVLFMLRSTLRVMLGQKVFLKFSWSAENATLHLVGPLVDHEAALKQEATKRLLGINWYALPPWVTWLSNGIVAVGQLWWMVSGRFRRSREVREEHFSVTHG